MLINKTNGKVTVTYNGKSRELASGESIDIRDFDIENKHIAGAEKHIMSKNPGIYEQKATVGDSKVESKYIDQIKAMQLRIDELLAELNKIKTSEKLAQEKHATSVGEVEAMKQQVASMKKEVDKYKATHDDLENEIQKLRESSRKVKL